MSVPSYSDIQHVAHKAIAELWFGPIEIQEKVDGSQISFMCDENDELLIRSKGAQIYEGSPSSKMFQEGVDAIRERYDLLVPGHIWRGEYLQKPKHNTLKYDRIPQGHIVIFDIELSPGEFATPEQRKEMAEFVGLEVVPTFYYGECPVVYQTDKERLKDFLDRESFLGGPKIEGIVVKNYTKFIGGKPMMGKLVSEAFKESHIKEWKVSNPGKKDVVESIIDTLRTDARWEKAVQHLRDAGSLVDGPQDIGPLMKEVPADVLKEEEDAIKEALFKAYWPQISRGVVRGFPEWYKERLLRDE